MLIPKPVVTHRKQVRSMSNILRQRFYSPDPELSARLSGNYAIIKEEFPMSQAALKIANRDLFLTLSINLAEGLEANHTITEEQHRFVSQIQLPQEPLEDREKKILVQLLTMSDYVAFDLKNNTPSLIAGYMKK